LNILKNEVRNNFNNEVEPSTKEFLRKKTGSEKDLINMCQEIEKEDEENAICKAGNFIFIHHLNKVTKKKRLDDSFGINNDEDDDDDL
jgi:hypothetical protein